MKPDERILVVDDNPRTVAILRKLLAGCTLAVAGSGEEALARAPEFQPHLVLLDLMMPGIDGYETCRRLRRMAGLMGPKIIMVSARAMLNERLQGYEAGADDYVTKPFDQDELLAKVKVYLRLSSLEHLDRLRDSLLTLLNHETRTPITCLVAAAESLRQQECPSVEIGEIVGMIERAARELDALIHSIVLLSSLRSGVVELEREPTDLGELARSAVEELRALADAKAVRLETITKEAPGVALDGRFRDLVLAPLVRNAIRFSDRGGRVVVEVAADPARGGTVVHVRDDGCGIAPELIPHVTEGFVVADIRHHGRGAGLSLPTARLFVQAHGGRLELDSAPGRGTRVTLRLPSLEAEEAPLDRAA